GLAVRTRDEDRTRADIDRPVVELRAALGARNGLGLDRAGEIDFLHEVGLPRPEARGYDERDGSGEEDRPDDDSQDDALVARDEHDAEDGEERGEDVADELHGRRRCHPRMATTSLYEKVRLPRARHAGAPVG